jgi:hypothetical protein
MSKFGRAGKGPVQPPKPGSIERLKALEDFRSEILRAVRKTFNEVEMRLRGLEEIKEALVNLVGRDQVEEEVKRVYIERAEARAAMEQKALEAALASGRAVEADTVGDLSVVVVSEVDKDGQQLFPTRSQLLFATLKPEFQEQLRGKKVGDVHVTPQESKVTIQAIYNVVPNPPEAQQAEPAPLPAGTPPTEGQPLSDAEEEAIVDQLTAVAEQIESEAKAVEEQLVEDLSN